jgi:hypothetical protein
VGGAIAFSLGSSIGALSPEAMEAVALIHALHSSYRHRLAGAKPGGRLRALTNKVRAIGGMVRDVVGRGSVNILEEGHTWGGMRGLQRTEPKLPTAAERDAAYVDAFKLLAPALLKSDARPAQ